MDTIAERLKWLRKERKKITLEELSKKVGVARATVQRYESGVIPNIPSDKIELLAEALDTTPGFIMGWEKDPDKFRLDGRFGKLLAEERKNRKMSKKEFADYIGISEEALERYETGQSIPGINVAMPIAIFLGISADEYDPVYTMMKEKAEHDALNSEIIQLLSSLSPTGKRQALDYIQLLALREGKQ